MSAGRISGVDLCLCGIETQVRSPLPLQFMQWSLWMEARLTRTLF